MNFKFNYSLLNHNSFSIDVKAKKFIEVKSTEELKEVLSISGDENKLIIGEGSNILFTKNFEGLVIHLNIGGIVINKIDDDYRIVTAGAGENWHDLVIYCLKNGLGGIENLSLIPGSVGAAPIQNIGAYGVELKDVFVSCEVLDKRTMELENYMLDDCSFGYRDSIFKKNKNLIITSLKLKLKIKNHNIISDYVDIKKELIRLNIDKPTINDISNAVCKIRKAKLPNPKIIGNAGSFFKNPIINSEKLDRLKKKYKDVPAFKLKENKYKIPAAWLIETAGFKGKNYGNFGVHQNQPLVLVNYGNAKGKDIYKLSISISKIIVKIFDIKLEAEVNII